LAASQRTGSWQIHWIEMPNGLHRVLTEATALNPAAFTLGPEDKVLLWFDGPELRQTLFAGMKENEVGRVRDGWTVGGPLVPSDDGTHAFYVESKGNADELRRVKLPRGGVETVLGAEGGIVEPLPNPRLALLLWRTRDGELWVAGFDGAGRRRVVVPAGKVLQAMWNPEGRGILYLHEPADPKQLIAIREQDLEGRADSLVARTSQFGRFSRNANASVFLGASRSKASPHILLLLRRTRRELTLCEHLASDVATALPLFTPNSQRLVFQSDRWTNPAIFMMNVERLVERTET
jgi:oligogalacturonide lyase